MRIKFLILILVFGFGLWQGFGNVNDKPNLSHFIKAKTILPSLPNKENTGEGVLLGGFVFRQANAEKCANNLRGKLLMSFRKTEFANDYG